MQARPGKALLFDIDGTLADTDAVHLEAFNLVLGPYGHVFDRKRYSAELQGFSNLAIGARLLGDKPPDRQQAILDEKEAAFRTLVVGRIVPMPGLTDIFALADRAGVPMVAVTNALRVNALLLLEGLGIAHRFQTVVIGAELPHSKPHPLPYLEGLRAVNADAAMSVAFEDSRSGVASAVAAGIATIGIRSGLSHDALIAAGAQTSAAAFDDPVLLAAVAAKMAW